MCRSASRPIGLYRNKAKNVIALSQKLTAEHGGEVPHEREALEALPGVGRKTANVVLNIAFGEPTLAVDTHVFRVAHRLELASGKTPLEVEMGLLKVIPNAYLHHAHHWLILHGRYVCQARKPKCDVCVVSDLCTSPDKWFDGGPAQGAAQREGFVMTVANGRQFLSIPGPTNVPDAVLAAMQRPAIDIYSGEMIGITDSCLADLKIALPHQAGRTYIYAANGHGGWEAALHQRALARRHRAGAGERPLRPRLGRDGQDDGRGGGGAQGRLAQAPSTPPRSRSA